MTDFWEKEYSKGNQVNKYPFSSIVSSISRHKHLLPSTERAIELGSGVGNNLTYLATIFDEVLGIEQSKTAVRVSREIHGGRKKIKHLLSDLTKLNSDSLPKADLVLDRATLMTLSPEQMITAFYNAFMMLKAGGLFISEGIYFADRSSHEKLGILPPQDQGSFAGKPPAWMLEQLEQTGFEVLTMIEITEKVLAPFEGEMNRGFRISAKKPENPQKQVTP